MLMNLINNSLKFTLEGEVNVKISYLEEDVKDVKIGSPRSDTPKIRHFVANRGLSFKNTEQSQVQSAR